MVLIKLLRLQNNTAFRENGQSIFLLALARYLRTSYKM